MPYLPKQIFVFFAGFTIGVILAVILFHDGKPKKDVQLVLPKTNFVSERELYEAWFEKSALVIKPIDIDQKSFSKTKVHAKTESDYLFRNVSVICVVFVKSNKNAYSVSNSWGKKCNKIHFFGENDNRYLKLKKFKTVSSWSTLCHSIEYVWNEHGHSIGWVLFAPDDLFVIPENLRYFLAPKHYYEPHYIGRKYLFWNQVYNKAEAGYLLSLGAIKLLANKLNSFAACDSVKYNGNEDYYLGKYLSEAGVEATGAEDDSGRERFHMFTPEQLMSPSNPEVIEKHSKYSLTPVKQGVECCSPTSVSFKGSQRDLLFFYSYLLYSVAAFNTRGSLGNSLSGRHASYDHVWKKFVASELGVGVDFRLISNEDYFKLWSSKISSPEEFNKQMKSILELKTT